MSSKTSLLRKLVSEVQNQLEQSFLERRILEHKHSPEEELHDIVPLLVEREQQLRRLAEASVDCLGEAEHVETELEQKSRENDACIRAQQTAQHELRLCTEALSQSEAKVSTLSKLLAETEQSRDQLSSELQIVTKTLSLVEKPESPRDSGEFNEAVVALETRCAQLESNCEGLGKDKTNLMLKTQEMEAELNLMKENLEKAKSENAKLREKQRNEKVKSNVMEVKLAQSEETRKFLEFDLSIAKKKIEKLEEDLTVEKDQSLSMSAYHERHISSRTFIQDDAASGDSSDEVELPATTRRSRRDLSLTLRDDILQDEELFSGMNRQIDLSPRASIAKHFTFDNIDPVIDITLKVIDIEILSEDPHRTRGFSFGTTITYSVDRVEDISVVPSTRVKNRHRPPIRKDPCEEFFILAVQAIKLNSPYLDDICTVCPSDLYHTAMDLNIPFHQWYPWIEERLRQMYLALTPAHNSGPMEILEDEHAGKGRKRK